MVIFGAGASFDSAQSARIKIVGGAIQYDGLPYRPPLANDLFADRNRAFAHLISSYSKMHPILPLLRERSQKSVEEVLEALQSEAAVYAERHRQLAAVRFYLRDLLWECTERWIEHTSGVTNYSPWWEVLLLPLLFALGRFGSTRFPLSSGSSAWTNCAASTLAAPWRKLTVPWRKWLIAI